MKRLKILLFAVYMPIASLAQIVYESPLGISLNFDKTWKRLPKEILLKKVENVQNALEYRSDIKFDACFQKIGNADMDYPYILLKNIYTTTNDDSEIARIKRYFTDKPGFDKVVKDIVNNKFDVEMKIGGSYYDKESKILLFTYDMGVSIKGNLVCMFAFYLGKNASLIVYCYSYKDEFKYDQKEFLDVIYSIKDTGMKSAMPKYIEQHDIAAKFYNQGLEFSNSGRKNEAIQAYSKAIENYPPEDSFVKAEAYYNRGLNKRSIDDYKGAIEDYNKAIEIRYDYYRAYNNRGYAKLLLEDYKGAIEDFTLTIKYDNYNTDFSRMAIGNRGIAKISIGLDGCADIKKSIDLGNNNLLKIYSEYCGN